MEQQRRGSTQGLKRKLAVVGAVAAMGVVGTMGAAEAATPAGPTVLAKYNVDFTTGATTGAAAQRVRVIHCEVRFIGDHGGIPHKSGHVHGTINVRTGVTCTQPLRMIRGKVGLFSNRGTKIKAFGSTGSRTAKGNAALVCRTGRYHGEVAATLYAPPGYTPPVATVGKKTRTVSIHC
ncbi:hypothetical protein [Actinomadura macrotermitis]|uniref:Uncharacterized protein n=1 Tax=Actinomadura macrotermitis TaxID=2585200 RepID=A0A7K0BUD8_9ACTN|nr:hypothetical protein [Actinomadura macrotermitis]MQY04808.1 hypothetical protein [Actinomadura macrotermitis]